MTKPNDQPFYKNPIFWAAAAVFVTAFPNFINSYVTLPNQQADLKVQVTNLQNGINSHSARMDALQASQDKTNETLVTMNATMTAGFLGIDATIKNWVVNNGGKPAMKGNFPIVSPRDQFPMSPPPQSPAAAKVNPAVTAGE